MKCPVCNGSSKNLETRQSGTKIRRRKECLKCGVRFSSYELIDTEFQDLMDKNLEVQMVKL